jgi:hypothetical protein
VPVSASIVADSGGRLLFGSGLIASLPAILLIAFVVTLSPGYPVIQSAQEVATEWAGEHLTAASLQELARDEVLRLAPLPPRATASRPGGEPCGAG